MTKYQIGVQRERELGSETLSNALKLIKGVDVEKIATSGALTEFSTEDLTPAAARSVVEVVRMFAGVAKVGSNPGIDRQIEPWSPSNSLS